MNLQKKQKYFFWFCGPDKD